MITTLSGLVPLLAALLMLVLVPPFVPVLLCKLG